MYTDDLHKDSHVVECCDLAPRLGKRSFQVVIMHSPGGTKRIGGKVICMKKGKFQSNHRLLHALLGSREPVWQKKGSTHTSCPDNWHLRSHTSSTSDTDSASDYYSKSSKSALTYILASSGSSMNQEGFLSTDYHEGACTDKMKFIS